MNLNLRKRDGLKRQGSLTRHLRWLSPSLITMAVIAVFVAAAPAAKADSFTYDFSLTDASGIVNIAFAIPSTSLTPTSFPDSDSFELAPVSYTLNGTTEAPLPVSFYDANDGGGMLLGDTSGTVLLNLAGSALFTGDPSAPTGFDLGTFDLTNFPDGGAVISDNFTLTITDPPNGPTAPTPEPSSLLLLGVGLIGLSGLIAYQQKKQGRLSAEEALPNSF